ncbi:MAG: hypothetical protein ACXVBE_11655 [Bdellovibrionota bacterium]
MDKAIQTKMNKGLRLLAAISIGSLVVVSAAAANPSEALVLSGLLLDKAIECPTNTVSLNERSEFVYKALALVDQQLSAPKIEKLEMRALNRRRQETGLILAEIGRAELTGSGLSYCH